MVVLSVVEQRYQAVLEVVKDGRTVVEVAARYGVSRQTVHAWIRRWEAGGLGALADRSQAPEIALIRCRGRWRPRSARCAGCIRSGDRVGCVGSWNSVGSRRCLPCRRSTAVCCATGWWRVDVGDAGARTFTVGSATGRWSCGSWM